MRPLAPFALALLLAACPGAAPSEAYRFSSGYNREDLHEIRPRILSLRGRPGSPAPGDLLALNAYCRWITVDGPGEYRFRDPGSVYTYLACGDTEQVVWFASGYEDCPAPPPEHLLGISVRSKDAETLGLLRSIDPKRTTVRVSASLLEDEAVLDAVPAGLERLVLCATWRRGNDEDPLARLTRFRELRALVAPQVILRDTETLTRFRELRALVLTEAEGLEDLAFVERLGKLAHLDVVGTGVTEEAIAALIRERPDLDLLWRREQPLRRITVDCNRLEVEWGREVDPLSEKDPLAVITGREAVAEFLDGIRFRYGQPCGTCSCEPSLDFDLWRQGDYVTTLGLVHGGPLRWRPGGTWLGDANLTPESHARLMDWLAERGIEFPR